MADTNTPNLNLIKPEIGGSDDTWGNKTNANWDTVDTAVFGKAARRGYVAKSASYTAVLADDGQFMRFTAAATLSLTAAATLTNKWSLTVLADGGDVTIDPNSTETIDGAATLVVPNGNSVVIQCDGAGFRTNKHAVSIDPVFVKSGALANKASFDLSALSAPRVIRVPDMDTALGVWEPIKQVAFAAQANVDFINLAPFRTLRLTGFLAASITPGGIGYRVSPDNGGTWNSGAGDYSYNYMLLQGATPVGAAGQGSMGYFANGSTDANQTTHFNAIFENFNVVNSTGIDKGVIVHNKGRTSGSISLQQYGNAINLSPAMSGLRIIPGGGGTITGHLILEGARG